MRTVTKYRVRAWAVAMSALALVAVPIVTQNSKADPSDGHGIAVTGLGQSSPPAADSSLASDWRVYTFEREGIRYLQVNGRDGRARAAVGYIGNTFWVLPVGTDPVSTPQRPLAIPVGAVRSVVYRSPEVELAVYTGRGSILWAVEVPAQ